MGGIGIYECIIGFIFLGLLSMLDVDSVDARVCICVVGLFWFLGFLTKSADRAGFRWGSIDPAAAAYHAR